MARVRALFRRLKGARTVPPEILALAPVLEAGWPADLHALRLSGVPLNADGDGDGDGSGDDGDGDGEEDDGGEASGDSEGDGDSKTADEYRKELRKYERNAKASSKKKDAEIEKLREALKKREDADKSEHEKALEKAREEGKAEALTASQKERRSDRLEAAVTRIAARGVQIGEGDDARTFKFADPEDAQVFIERRLNSGDLDEAEIFDDEHKVRADALTEALADLATEKPRLEAESNGSGRPSGDAGARKGKSGGKSDDDKSIDEHLNSIRRHK